jgi:hypothetical protein
MADIPELGGMNLVHLQCFHTRAHTHTRVGRDGLGSSSTFSHTHTLILVIFSVKCGQYRCLFLYINLGYQNRMKHLKLFKWKIKKEVKMIDGPIIVMETETSRPEL